MAKRRREDDALIRLFRRLAYMYYHEKIKFFAIVIGVLVGISALVYFLTRSPSVPGNANYEFTEAVLMYASGDNKSAEERFKSLLGRYGAKGAITKSYFYLGKIYYEERRYNEAIRNFKKFISKFNKKSFLIPAAYMGIAACYEEMNNISEAIKYYEKVKKYKKSPHLPYALLKMARLNEKLGNYDKALEIYQEIIENHRGTWAATWAKADRERLMVSMKND